MTEFFSTTVSFLIVIGILVFVHELGHFLTAIWTGMRADVFSLGMGPRALGWNKITGFTFGKLPENIELGGHTDYRLCWFPIGGYVKIIGMVDESFDTSFEGKPVEPWEFRAKKNWQKAIVLSAGVFMNLALAVVVFWFMPLVFGHEEMATTRISWVEPASVAAESGFMSGDKILTVDGRTMETWNDVVEYLNLSQSSAAHKVIVDRNGSRTLLSVDGLASVRAMASGKGLGIFPDGNRVQLGGIVSYAPADKAGLKTGDVLLAVDSTPVVAVVQLQKYVRTHAGQPVTIHVERGTQTMPISVTVGSDSAIGVELAQEYVGARRSESFNVTESFSMAVSEVGKTIGLIYSSIAHVFAGDVGVRQSIGGPIRIAQMASKSQELGLEPYLRFMALISISLGVMNLLPLPGLDGGHLVFVGIEAVLRREISTKIKMRFQQAGFALLILLMVFVFYLDLTR